MTRATRAELEGIVSGHLAGSYDTFTPRGIPEPKDIALGSKAARLEATALFIDVRQSSDITNALRRQTAAKMLKSYFDGAVRIIRGWSGEVVSFNGDGMLALFVGRSRTTNAVKAAMQVDWFVENMLRPRFNRYFDANRAARGKRLGFAIGCGIDDSDIYAVRIGIRGTNDIAWVGRSTNTAAKLSNLLRGSANIAVTRAAYGRLNAAQKNTSSRRMWSDERSAKFGGVTRAYRTTTWWRSIG